MQIERLLHERDDAQREIAGLRRAADTEAESKCGEKTERGMKAASASHWTATASSAPHGQSGGFGAKERGVVVNQQQQQQQQGVLTVREQGPRGKVDQGGGVGHGAGAGGQGLEGQEQGRRMSRCSDIDSANNSPPTTFDESEVPSEGRTRAHTGAEAVGAVNPKP